MATGIAGQQNIIATVLLQIKDATAQWQYFARAGTQAFREVGVAAKQATTQVNASLKTVNRALDTTQKRIGQFARGIKSAGVVMAGTAAVLYTIGNRAETAFGKTAKGASEAEHFTMRLDHALVPLGEDLSHVNDKLLELVETFSKWYKSLSDTQQLVVAWSIKLAPVVAGAVIILGSLIWALNQIGVLGPTLTIVSALIIGTIEALGIVAALALTPLASLITFLTELTTIGVGAFLAELGPIIAGIVSAFGLWVLAAIALGAALGALVFYWDDVMAALMDAQHAIESFLKDSWQSIISYIQGLWDSFTGWFQGRVDALLGWLDGLISKAKTAWAWLQKVTGQEGSVAPGFAVGGSTARGGLAMLHPNEFVLRANAVRKYGLQFLYALNAGLITPFANGGVMAPRGMSFAHAGISPGSAAKRPITLNINGETFAGLLAPETIADKLIHFARKTQTLSGGKKPDWYK